MKKSVLLIVNSGIRASIHSALTQYVSDLEHIEGYSVCVYETSGGSAFDLKNYIVDKYHSLTNTNPLAGCIFIGDLPVPWCGDALYKDPIDLFYMDVHGTWEDTNFDGIIDQYPHQPNPVIWIGRIAAGKLSGDEATLLNFYFQKNHNYRIGMLDVPDRAMAYVDDDWTPKGDYGLSSVYDDVTVINDEIATNANDYKSRLSEKYEFLQCAVHSSAFAHTFKVNHVFATSVTATEIRNIVSRPVFYCLDACNAARYTEVDYIGGWYLFSNGQGLALIGETKTGNGMDEPGEFYSLFRNGLCLGDAFIQWLGKNPIRPSYHIERTILGDPTLRRRSFYPPTVTPPPPRHDLAIDPLALILSPEVYIKLHLPDPPPWDAVQAYIRKFLSGKTSEQKAQISGRVRKVRVLIEALEKELENTRNEK